MDISNVDNSDRFDLEYAIYELCKESPMGADFLISAFVQSIRSYRRPTICAPFPTSLFSTSGPLPDKDFWAAENSIAHIPHTQNIIYAGRPSPASRDHPLSAMPLRALRLLHWILSYRHKVRMVMDPSRDLENLFLEGKSVWAVPGNGLGVSPAAIRQQDALRPHYVIEIEDPEDGCWDQSTENFEAARASGGSFMAFHGTAAENVHCVLRCGLLNMTGTKQQRNGAIFGDGIYLSTDPAVAFAFSEAGEGWERSMFGTRVRYLLFCEVANAPEVLRSTSTSPEALRLRMQEQGERGQGVPANYVLALNKDLVKVRYIFVYVEPSRRVLRIQDRGPTLPRSVGTAGIVGNLEVAAEPVGGPAVSASWSRKVDWCKVVVVAYVAILLGVGLLDSASFRYGRLPTFLQFK